MKIEPLKGLVFLILITCISLQALESTAQDIIPVSVSVTGDVQQPGVYTLTNMNRLSEAISMADYQPVQSQVLKNQSLIPQGISIPRVRLLAQPDTSLVKTYNHRNITLNRSGQKQILDLQKYLILGEISQNPFLKDGDVIIVNSVRSTVTIEGSVRKPGDYEYREGDTIEDILNLAMGVTEDADLKHANLYRYKTDFIDFERISLDLSGYQDNADNFVKQKLQPGDRILIPANSEFRKAYKVEILGKVKMPGTYYVNDKTSIYELLTMCGGPSQEADLYSSYAYNKLVSESFDPDFTRLSTYSMLQMTWLEYSYLRTKTRQLKGKYSVDILKCWQSKGSEANLVLKNGDVVVIPEMINGVWVAGQVRHPGLINWTEDMNWEDYLSAAGGYANNRKMQGIRIIRYSSGNWVKPTKSLKLFPGDTIFVPDKQERYLWDDIKEAILITSQLLTVLIALRTF